MKKRLSWFVLACVIISFSGIEAYAKPWDSSEEESDFGKRVTKILPTNPQYKQIEVRALDPEDNDNNAQVSTTNETSSPDASVGPSTEYSASLKKFKKIYKDVRYIIYSMVDLKDLNRLHKVSTYFRADLEKYFKFVCRFKEPITEYTDTKSQWWFTYNVRKDLELIIKLYHVDSAAIGNDHYLNSSGIYLLQRGMGFYQNFSPNLANLCQFMAFEIPRDRCMQEIETEYERLSKALGKKHEPRLGSLKDWVATLKCRVDKGWDDTLKKVKNALDSPNKSGLKVPATELSSLSKSMQLNAETYIILAVGCKSIPFWSFPDRRAEEFIRFLYRNKGDTIEEASEYISDFAKYMGEMNLDNIKKLLYFTTRQSEVVGCMEVKIAILNGFDRLITSLKNATIIYKNDTVNLAYRKALKVANSVYSGEARNAFQFPIIGSSIIVSAQEEKFHAKADGYCDELLKFLGGDVTAEDFGDVAHMAFGHGMRIGPNSREQKRRLFVKAAAHFEEMLKLLKENATVVDFSDAAEANFQAAEYSNDSDEKRWFIAKLSYYDKKISDHNKKVSEARRRERND